MHSYQQNTVLLDVYVKGHHTQGFPYTSEMLYSAISESTVSFCCYLVQLLRSCADLAHAFQTYG